MQLFAFSPTPPPPRVLLLRECFLALRFGFKFGRAAMLIEKYYLVRLPAQDGAQIQLKQS